MKITHALLLSLALLPGCTRDTLKLDVPVNAIPDQGSRIVVVYERGPEGWKQSQASTYPIMTRPPMVPPPAETTAAPVSHPKKEGCEIYVLPSFQPTPPLPVAPPRGKGENEDAIIDLILSGHIGELRQYIISIKRQLKQSHDDYLKNCSKEKVSTYRPDRSSENAG